MTQMDRRKIRLLNRLAEAGVDTEKKISRIDLRTAYEQGLSDEIGSILDLQNAIRSHRVITYLLNGTDEQKEAKAHGETVGSEERGTSAEREYWSD